LKGLLLLRYFELVFLSNILTYLDFLCDQRVSGLLISIHYLFALLILDLLLVFGISYEEVITIGILDFLFSDAISLTSISSVTLHTGTPLFIILE